MFDSHGDLNTFESSPSGNFHGMWLRGLMSDFSQDQISTIAPVALKESDVFFVGNLILEDSEVTFTQEHSIKNIETNNPYDTSLLNDFISRFNHLHISFDIDVLNQSLAPATGTPNPNGLSLETAIPLLELCFNHSSWSFDLVEVNPEKDGAEETLENAEQILEILKRRLA